MLFFIKIIACFIPKKTWRRAFRRKFINKKIYKNQLKKYKVIVNSVKNKIIKGEKVKVAFFVVFDSVFPARTIFEDMLIDNMFEPYIVVIPDTSRGEENEFYQMDKTYSTFVKQYQAYRVLYSYDKKTKSFIDFSFRFDLVCFANPYDLMTDKLFSIKYNAEKGVLPFYVNYGSMPDYYARNHIINLPSLNLCWKVFVDTKDNFDDVLKYTDIEGKNSVLSGYCKMDALSNISKRDLVRKKIIIAPHHTVNMPDFSLSNFLEYSDFFLELPKRYPQIDFVFRPHPLLFVTLSREDLWGKQKAEEYIEKITSYSNVEYQNGGDYFDTFVNSNAIIHDCSSFVIEYLYTGHPACYMLKSQNEIEKMFAPIGQKCLNNYYYAFNEDGIMAFIENVVLQANDPMKEERIRFAKEEIMINYPNATKYIIKNLKEEFV